jgi:prefoldin subunit 5
MPRDEVEKLKDRIDELESENDALQDQIDSISDIISREDEEGKTSASLRLGLV